MNQNLWLLLGGLGTIYLTFGVIYLFSENRKIRSRIHSREVIPFTEQFKDLSRSGNLSIQTLESAWNFIAQCYGFNPDKLRLDDTIRDLNTCDYFGGDMVLGIEALVQTLKIDNVHEDITLAELVKLIAQSEIDPDMLGYN